MAEQMAVRSTVDLTAATAFCLLANGNISAAAAHSRAGRRRLKDLRGQTPLFPPAFFLLSPSVVSTNHGKRISENDGNFEN